MALICLTPNVIETQQMLRRKIIETRGHFPNDDASVKVCSSV
jgi:transposase-like protein